MDEATLQPPPKRTRKPRKAIVPAGNRGLTFTDLDSMYRFCVAVANSKEFKDIETPEQALMRLQAGLELGLSPIWAICNIMVVNGRPSVWGDAMLGLVLRHPECEDVIETVENEGTENETAVCEVRRRGRVPVIRKFSITDVRRAGLDRKMQSVHGSYPARMRAMRARSWACRDAFADALRGLAVVEDVRDYVERQVTKIEVAKAKDLILPDEVKVSTSPVPPVPEGGKPPAQEPISSEGPSGSEPMVVESSNKNGTHKPASTEQESNPSTRKTALPEDEQDEIPF
jgi:hypothetical protein